MTQEIVDDGVANNKTTSKNFNNTRKKKIIERDREKKKLYILTRRIQQNLTREANKSTQFKMKNTF